MRTAFGHWKYIVKNLWLVLPFAVLPAVFLALCLDYSSVNAAVRAFSSGDPRLGFLEFFRTWSLIRTDSLLGGIYTLLAFFCIIVCAVPMLVLVEKHMRIGKRTLSGLLPQSLHLLFSAVVIAFAYLALFEIFAILLSALLFVISEISITALVYVFFTIVVLLLVFALLYVATIPYLWLPCRQATGFRAYDAFVYSYRLMAGVRWKLIGAFAVSFFVSMAVTAGFSMLPEAVFRIVLVILYAALFLSFFIRMETVYYETDKLDREDLLLSYRGY